MEEESRSEGDAGGLEMSFERQRRVHAEDRVLAQRDNQTKGRYRTSRLREPVRLCEEVGRGYRWDGTIGGKEQGPCAIGRGQGK